MRASRAGAHGGDRRGELAGELVRLALEERRERLPGEIPLVEEEERLATRLPAADRLRRRLRPGRLAAHAGRSEGRCASISSR